MGLASSQARLLFLTSRQSDVEGQLMSLANDKLSISRQCAKAAEDHNRATNAMKLTWNTPDGDMDLNYALLMRPNIANDSGQYLLRDINNAVILDDNYISDLGIPDAGRKNSLILSQQEFLMALMGCTSDVADGYVNTAAASGGNTTTSGNTFTTWYRDSDIINKSVFGWSRYSSIEPIASKDDWFGTFVHMGYDPSIDIKTITNGFSNLLNDVHTQIGGALLDSLSNNLGEDYKKLLNEACIYAKSATYNKFVYAINDADSRDGVQMGTPGTEYLYKRENDQNNYDNIGAPNNLNRICYKSWQEYHNPCYSDYYTRVEVDNSQVVDTYLNYFDKYCAEHFGGEYTNQIGDWSSWRGEHGGTGEKTGRGGSTSSEVNEDDPNINDDINTNKVSDAYEASYYINLYNAINRYGWVRMSNVDSEDYLQNQVMYGNISISEMQGNNWVNLSTSSSDSPLGTERDDDAIAKADNEYDKMKNLLDYKESQITIRMNDLDAERSGITTEIDSVNSILKKQSEKFKMFDA